MIKEKFEAIVQQFRIPLEEQPDVLIQAAESHPLAAKGVGDFLDTFREEMAKTLPAEPEKASAANMTAGATTAPFEPTPPSVANTDAFFDRDLAKHCLNAMTAVHASGPIFERPGHDTARLLVPPADLHWAKSVLQQDVDQDEGAIVGGWHFLFADGTIAALAVTAANATNGGCFIDAFLILPDGFHPTAPNPSLAPCYTVDEPFTFLMPDGNYKVVSLVPSTT